MGPDLVHHPLARADGSTVLSSRLFTVIASVNGPIEVQRRDELPEEAAIEVNLRPSSGTGGPRERWLESVLQSALKSIVLVNMYPRTLIQITLQITKEPSLKLRKTAYDISLLPTLLNAAFTALAVGGLPLATTSSAALAVVSGEGEVLVEPKEKDVANCRSIHAAAFNASGAQILNESSGTFDLDTMGTAVDLLQQACIAAIGPVGDDTAMYDGDHSEPWLRRALQEEARTAEAWRETT